MGNLLVALLVLGMVVVHAQKPFGVLGVTMLVQKGVFILGGGSVLAPVIAAVLDHLAVADQVLRVPKSLLI